MGPGWPAGPCVEAALDHTDSWLGTPASGMAGLSQRRQHTCLRHISMAPYDLGK